MNLARTKKAAAPLVLLFLLTLGAAGCQNEEPVAAWSPGKPLAREAVKIGILYVDGAETGYSYAHDLGLRKAMDSLGLSQDQVIRKLNVNDVDPAMIEHNMSEAISEGANIIIATSWGYMDTCEKLALEHPSVVFAHATGYKKNNTNFTHYFGRLYQARYLSGVAAGLKTRTGKLGFVAAQDKSNSEVTGGLNAFSMGVESVNPQAKIYVSVTHSWFDPAGERQATRKLIDEGCDVIAQHCDSPSPQLEAEAAGVWGIGYNSDMSREAPGAVLTSAIWNWEAYYTFLIDSVIDGTFTTAPYYGSLADGLVDITPLSEALTTDEMAAAVAGAKARMLNEHFNVFDGEMETNDGRIIGTAGKTLPDSEIVGGIDWYYRNITELD